MKKTIWILLLLFGTAFASQKEDAAFDRGNALYRQEKYADAAKSYESVLASGMQSAEVYFNLGNAYYKLNKVAPAVYNYEKALLLDPGNPRIENNLQFAHKMMIDEVREVPKAGFGKILGDFTSALTIDGWAWLAVLLAFAFLGAFCGYYFSGLTLYKRLFFIAMCVLAVAVLLSVFSAAMERGRQQKERPAIVFDGIAAVKTEPRTSASDATSVHEGTKVYVQETLDKWKRVTLPDGSDGWMDAGSIKEIKQP
jgi:tetratricopeptide (TPR) repeat protein